MANSVAVKNVTLRYSPEEDRLLLKCHAEGKYHFVWWTQRLWQRLWPVLIERLEKQLPANSSEVNELYHALAQQKADESLVQHSQRAKQDLAVKDVDLADPFSAAANVEHQANILCTKVEFAFQKHALKMMMFSVDDKMQFDVHMSISQLRQFLLALSRCLLASNWPQNTPDWLLPETNLSSKLGKPIH